MLSRQFQTTTLARNEEEERKKAAKKWVGRWVGFAALEGDDETDAGNVTYQRKSAFSLLCCPSSEGSSLRVSFPHGLEASEDLAYDRERQQHHLQSVSAPNFLRRRLNRESARSAKLFKNSEMGCCL